MNIENLQNALFAAYDLRNAMNSEDKNRPTENDTIQNTPRHTTISFIIEAATIAGVDMDAGHMVCGFMYVPSRNEGHEPS